MKQSITVLTSLFSLLPVVAQAEDVPPKKPNIIFIMADDLGYADLSCYGSKFVKTPHLDALATGGVKCLDFHSNGAVCSPTRAALMTGRYQQRSGVDGVITAKSHRHVGLATAEWTLAEAMKEQGYVTGLFGKWHLGYAPEFNPIRQGFDEFSGFVSGNIDYHRHIDQEGHFDWWVQDKIKEEPGYLTDLVSDHAIKFIRRHKETPFCLMLAHGAPHYPIQGRMTQGFRVLGKTHAEQPRLRLADPAAVYAEMIEVMDEGVGHIVAELEKQSLRNNTLIVFCSDNGPTMNQSAAPYRGKKATIWEGGHRVCGIFNWPGKLAPGQECSVPLMTMDMFPTFVNLAGGNIPAERNLDGKNIWPQLQGEVIEREPLFWKHGANAAVRVGQWKLIGSKKKSSLYHLAVDPSESSDLAQQQPEKVKQMRSLLDAWLVDVKPAN